jgi:DNA-binding NarL/FixJ family response regulator
VIIDEHPMVREWLAQKIRNEVDLQICGHAEDVGAAIEVISSQKPHLVITELSLPNAPGIEIVRSIRARFASLPQLVFSRYDEGQCAEAAISAGAHGFLSKREGGASVKAAIRRVLSGQIYLSERMSALVLHSFASGGDSLVRSPRHLLSRRELELFTLIGDGFKPTEIALKMAVGVKTVESFSARIRQKLGLENARELFRCAVEWAKTPIR